MKKSASLEGAGGGGGYDVSAAVVVRFVDVGSILLAFLLSVEELSPPQPRRVFPLRSRWRPLVSSARVERNFSAW